ncbi:MAG TPA: carboxynorspermidine decarboxylase [Bacteroidales bacterium]|nr:carboxynorspermidine decarboxylase [Bacteroidales bacterium]
MEAFGKINLNEKQLRDLKTPCYIVNESRIEENLVTINHIQDATGAKVLLALKGFAMWSLFPLIRKHLSGIAASSLNEARLGKEEFGGELHVYAPAYADAEFSELLRIADHISFNSINQWNFFKDRMKGGGVKPAMRINPEHSEVETTMYDPCAPFSRLGIKLENFTKGIEFLDGITGLHFHNLCELNSDALERTLEVVKKKFGFYFDRISWINFGGGHHITRQDYDLEKLIRIINDFRLKYPVEVYLEPGEAIALNTGILVTTVMDVFNNGMDIAILDTSAAAHMPDVLEMPYRPPLLNGFLPEEKNYVYRLGGMTCLAGDVIGDYSFDKPLEPGQKLIFGDMAHYTMVKNTTFNGVNLPDIYVFNSDTGELKLIRSFGYEDYKNRLS